MPASTAPVTETKRQLAQGSKPGHLTLGELSGVDLDEFDGFGQAAAAFDVLDDLAVSDGLTGGTA